MKGAFLVVHVREPSIAMTKAQQRRTWNEFVKHGTSHSAGAGTLVYLINRCEREGISYRLSANPGMGYRMEPGMGMVK
jgi:hypothetical protein